MNDPICFALMGAMGAGKSTLAGYFRSAYGYEVKSFATPLKEAVAREAGITLEELRDNKAKYRSTLQEVGERGRAADANYWVKLLGESLTPGRATVVDDCRYINEADYLRGIGFCIVRLEVNQDTLDERYYQTHKRYPGPNERKHPSELAWRRYPADIIIDANDSADIVAAYCNRALLRWARFRATRPR